MPKDTICSIDGCGKIGRTRKGLCSKHYERQRVYGTTDGSGTVRHNGLDITQWMLDHATYSGDSCLRWPFAYYRNGYGSVYDFDGRHTVASRLMCRIVHGDPPDDNWDCAHTCGKGHEGCVNPNHLLWKTRADNHADKLEHGTHDRGEKSINSKLNEEQVRYIRSMRGKCSQLELAEAFGVSFQNVSDIQLGNRWKWLK